MPATSLALVTPLLGPFTGPDGQPVTFLVCTEGERLNAFIGPFYEEKSIADDLAYCAGHGCANAHFRTARVPADGIVIASRNYFTGSEDAWATEWVAEWDERPAVKAALAARLDDEYGEPF